MRQKLGERENALVNEVEKHAHIRIKQLDMTLQESCFAVSLAVSNEIECKQVLAAHSSNKDDTILLQSKKQIEKHMRELRKQVEEVKQELENVSVLNGELLKRELFEWSVSQVKESMSEIGSVGRISKFDDQVCEAQNCIVFVFISLIHEIMLID